MTSHIFKQGRLCISGVAFHWLFIPINSTEKQFQCVNHPTAHVGYPRTTNPALSLEQDATSSNTPTYICLRAPDSFSVFACAMVPDYLLYLRETRSAHLPGPTPAAFHLSACRSLGFSVCTPRRRPHHRGGRRRGRFSAR